MRRWARLPLFQVGLIAASLQVVLVTAVTPLVILLAEYRDNELSVHSPDPPFSVVSLLQVTYLACAAGVALTKNRYVTLTSSRIKHASRVMPASDPDRAAGTMAICLGFISIGCAAYVLQAPPVFLATLDWQIGAHTAAAPVLWSALMSVCVASFGSSAHAAADAVELDR